MPYHRHLTCVYVIRELELGTTAPSHECENYQALRERDIMSAFSTSLVDNHRTMLTYLGSPRYGNKRELIMYEPDMMNWMGTNTVGVYYILHD